MTKEQALELLDFYDKKASECPIGSVGIVAGMRERFPEDGSEKKAMRWLGFAQGIMVATGLFPLERVKQHSKEKVHGAD